MDRDSTFHSPCDPHLPVPPSLRVQIFGLEFLLGSEALWPLLLALTALPAILQTILLPFCAESPRYLLISLNQEDEARKGQPRTPHGALSRRNQGFRYTSGIISSICYVIQR
jgi:hypothetical protein